MNNKMLLALYNYIMNSNIFNEQQNVPCFYVMNSNIFKEQQNIPCLKNNA